MATKRGLDHAIPQQGPDYKPVIALQFAVTLTAPGIASTEAAAHSVAAGA